MSPIEQLAAGLRALHRGAAVQAHYENRSTTTP